MPPTPARTIPARVPGRAHASLEQALPTRPLRSPPPSASTRRSLCPPSPPRRSKPPPNPHFRPSSHQGVYPPRVSPAPCVPSMTRPHRQAQPPPEQPLRLTLRRLRVCELRLRSLPHPTSCYLNPAAPVYRLWGPSVCAAGELSPPADASSRPPRPHAPAKADRPSPPGALGPCASAGSKWSPALPRCNSPQDAIASSRTFIQARANRRDWQLGTHRGALVRDVPEEWECKCRQRDQPQIRT
jgi:hypothetical protein